MTTELILVRNANTALLKSFFLDSTFDIQDVKFSNEVHVTLKLLRLKSLTSDQFIVSKYTISRLVPILNCKVSELETNKLYSPDRVIKVLLLVILKKRENGYSCEYVLINSYIINLRRKEHITER